ncbi:CoA-binding protein [Candidatus Parcubacteria bacterium]|nr:CoA-binding protein [Candidatus Parcubacteria bacterium]
MNLDKIFKPKTIAVIGASPVENSVGFGLIKNLSVKGHKRKIFCVNPNYQIVYGYECYKTINQIEEKVDLAIIAVKAQIVEKIVDQCIEKRVGGVIIVSAGFAESGKDGKILQDQIAKKLKENHIPLIGPNCLGILNPLQDLNASFAPAMPKKGQIAFVSQSGALIDSVIDLALTENFGFSKIISLGNMADLDLIDFLEYLIKDKDTKVITLYIESIRDGKKFLNAAKKSRKPIIVIKAGKTSLSKEAVSTHTGSLAGDYEVYKTAFKQAEVIETDSIIEMFDIAKAISWQPAIKNGVAIVTNGGGVGILTVDYCFESGIKLPALKEMTIKKIDKKMHPAWSKRNPIDVLGDADPSRYQTALNEILKQHDVYGVIVIQTLQMMTNPLENAKVIIDAKEKFPNKAIICSFVGGHLIQNSIDLLEENNIPNYTDPRRAVIAMNSLIRICKKKSIFFGLRT